MLKAADALAAAGYRVRVISTRHLPWAVGADREVRRLRETAWTWATVDYERDAERSCVRCEPGSGFAGRSSRRGRSGHRDARSASPRPRGAALHRELVRAAMREPVDLLYGGGAALAAVAEAGRKMDVPYAIDLEDFHSAEQVDSPAATLSHALAQRIERDVLPGALFLTASSPGIAAAYAERYGVSPIVVHNTFPLPSKPPDLHPHPDAARCGSTGSVRRSVPGEGSRTWCPRWRSRRCRASSTSEASRLPNTSRACAGSPRNAPRAF